MPRQAWSAKRERQYRHIKEGLEHEGRSEAIAEEIAARTVNKARARAGESRTATKLSLDDLSSSRMRPPLPWRGAEVAPVSPAEVKRGARTYAVAPTCVNPRERSSMNSGPASQTALGG